MTILGQFINSAILKDHKL